MRRFLLVILLFLVGCREMCYDPITTVRDVNGNDGTGFYIRHNNRRYLVTAKHLVSRETNGWDYNYRDVHVTSAPSGGEAYEVSCRNVPTALLDNEEGRRDWPIRIVSLGCATRGFVCGRALDNRERIDIILTTARMRPGMSGSPVLDEDGKVLGVAVQILTGDGQARSACTPIAWALAKMK